jgi:hypothetical protein
MKSTKTNKAKMTQTIPAPAKRTTAPAKAPEPMTTPARATTPVPAAVSTPKTSRITTSEPKPSRVATTASATAITPEEIARRAYAIWEAQGRPAGKETEHWLQAETQLKTSQSFSE